MKLGSHHTEETRIKMKLPHPPGCPCRRCNGKQSHYEGCKCYRCKLVRKEVENPMKNPEIVNKQKGVNSPKYGKKQPQEVKDKHSKTIKQKYDNDPDYRQRQAKGVTEGMKLRPTELDFEMIAVIQSNNLPYIYTGDGSFLIGYKNPDFIHLEKNICIEVGNTFHHNLKYIKERTEHFARYGWKCFIFICNEVDEQEVLKTLLPT